MSYDRAEYLKLRQKRLEEEKKKNKKKSSQTKTTAKASSADPYDRTQYLELRKDRLADKKNNDVAPVRTTTTAPVRAEVDDDGFDFFQKGAFKDGYQFGDVTKAILGTAGDVGAGVVKGAAKMVGGVIDAGAYGVAGAADLVGADGFADKLRVKAKENQVDNYFERIDSYLDQHSLLGKTSDAIAEGLGQVGTVILTGGLAGAAGLGAVGASAVTAGAMGVSSMGAGMSEAYEAGATDEEAATYGLIKGVVDAGSEMIFGGLGKTVKALGLSRGLSSLDDMFAQKLTNKITNQVAKNFVEFGVKASAEGVEEVLAGIGTAAGKHLTYMHDEELLDLIENEDLLEQFVVGAVTSGIAQSGIVPSMKSGSLVESNKKGRDFISGMSQNEKKVIDKVVEDRIAEEEKTGKLTEKEKNKIYEDVVSDMEKGYISVDTIEEVLGGDSYKSYKDTVDSEDALAKEYEELGKKSNATLAEQSRYAELKTKMDDIKQNSQRGQLKSALSENVMSLVKNDRLSESYNERARRGQSFEADLSKYNEKQKAVIQKAAESGILNNTRRTHEFVDMIAKISADKGVPFDFTNNAKLKDSGFAVEGKTVNGFVTKDGVTLNIDSAKSLNSVTGHEITHVLEGTELYDALQKTVIEYAKTKGDYQSRYDSLTKLYEGIEDADVNAELTADLVGDYLFTDSDFINNLSTNNRNVFQKIYDEIKYLCKVATAGSKEARELEKVKRAFEKAYQNGGKAQSDTKYSVSNSNYDRDFALDLFAKLAKEHPSMFAETAYALEDITSDDGFVREVKQFNAKTASDDEIKAIGERLLDLHDQNNEPFTWYGIDLNRADSLNEQRYRDADSIIPALRSMYQEIGGYVPSEYNDERYARAWVTMEGQRILDEGATNFIHGQTIPEENRAKVMELVKNAIALEQRLQTVRESKAKYSVSEQRSGVDVLIEQARTGLRILEENRDISKGWAKEKHAELVQELDDLLIRKYGVSGRHTQLLDALQTKQEELEDAVSSQYPDRAIIERLEREYADAETALDNFAKKYLYEDDFLDDSILPWEDTKHSISDSDGKQRSYAEIMEEQTKLHQRDMSLIERKREANNNPELLQALDDYSNLFSELRNLLPKKRTGVATQAELDRIEEIKTLRDEQMNRIAELNESLGLNAIAEEEREIRELRESLRVAADEAWAREGAEKKNKAIEKSGLSAPEYFRKKALKAFKTTANFNEAGYMLPDGKLLNFSGGERNRRYRDHREIGEIYEATQGTAALNRFLSDGNIRIMAESPGIDIASGVEPTKEQYVALKKFINSHGTKEGRFFVDFSDTEGHRSGNYSYEGRVNADRVINDIKHYYATGEIRQQSSVAQFRYSLSEDSDGRKLSGGQSEYFKDSKAVDESGRLQKVYHGTRNANFTVFKQNYNFYTDSKETAESYAPSSELYEGYVNITNPFVIDANGEKWSGIAIDSELKKLLETYGSSTFKDRGKWRSTSADIVAAISDMVDEGEADYDGVIIRNVDDTGSYFKGEGGAIGTDYITFSSKQFKNADNLNPTADPDIRHSLSNEGEQIAPVGNYNVYGEDIALEAPVAENATTTPTDDAYEADRIESLTDADAPPEKEDTSPERPIKTVEDRHKAKVTAVQTELSNNQRLREESRSDFDQEIARLRAEYDAKKNKNTKAAQDILRRIERMARLRDSVDADYAKRISDLEGRVTKMNSKEFKTAEQRKTKQQEYASQMESLVGDTSTWVDKKLGISYRVNTLRRNLRDIVRDASGKRDVARADAIYNELQGKYNTHEAMLNREANRIKGAYAEQKITKAEDAYIQMLGEFRHNPDTTLTEDVVKDFYEKNKNNIDEAKVDKIIEDARKTYDELLVRVNEVLREQGMKEIPYRKGYFPHFTEEKQGFLAKLFNWKTQNNDIPTDIAGLTEQFNPNRSWQSFNKQRKGDTTDYSFTKGLDTYVQGSLDWIYHIEDIQKRRAFENHIRYIHSEKGVQEKIDAIRSNDEYDADEAQEQIDLVLKEAGNPLNNFVTDLRAGTNTLANKKSSLDRGVEEMTNRKFYSTMTNISNRVSANMVGGSVSSALTNFIPITQSWGEVSPVSSLRAMGDTIRSTFRDDGVVEKSDFLTNRLRKSENLYKTTWDKISDKVALLMEGVDNFTSQTVWRSKYMENISKGMSENEAIKNADQFAENVIAGRSRGNMPTIFDSKNPLIKTLTAFQLEVSNQYGYMFKDMPQEMKDESIGKLVKGYASIFLGAYAYNALYSSLVGRDAAFDPISIIEELVGDIDDEDEDAGMNLLENVLDEVPFVGGLMGGGRIPIASAIPYDGNFMDVAEGVSKLAEGDYSDLTSEWMKPVYYLALPVGGGQIKKTVQGLKMFSDDHPIAGSYTDSGKLRFTVEDNLANRVKAGIFGQYASKNARQYFDEGRSPLSEKQIQELVDIDAPIQDYWAYRDGLKEQETIEDKFEYINDLDMPVAKKNILINNVVDRKERVDLTDYDKFSGYEEFDFYSKNEEKYNFLKENGVSYKDYKSSEDVKEQYDDIYSWYKNNPEKVTVAKAVTGNMVEYRGYTSALNDIRADKNSSGKSISGSAKRKKIDYINSLDLDYGARLILFKSEYKADDSYNMEIIEYLNGRDDISYDDMVTILKELDMKVDSNGNVTW